MQVMFFYKDGYHQPQLDQRVVEFFGIDENPAPARALLEDHFRQAVLANMRGSGESRDLDYDKYEHSRSMETFESGGGKQWLEIFLADRLIPDVDGRQATEIPASTCS